MVLQMFLFLDVALNYSLKFCRQVTRERRYWELQKPRKIKRIIIVPHSFSNSHAIALSESCNSFHSNDLLP
jgi:hypothetical protein